MPGGRPKKIRNGPKKPLSAYTLFVVEVRHAVSQQNPEMPFKEVAAKVGQMWRELPNHHREKYQRLAESDKVRYEREKEDYKLHQNIPQLEEEAKQKRKKRKGAPKNPLSAYTYYIMDVRKDVALNNPHMSFKDVAVHVGKMWRNLDHESRQMYLSKAIEDKQRYEREMQDWTQNLSEQPHDQSNEPKKKKKKEGPKNPLSAYTYFVIKMRPVISAENPKLTFGQVAVEVGRRWRNLSSEEKAQYEASALIDKQRYEKEKEDSKNNRHGPPYHHHHHHHHHQQQQQQQQQHHHQHDVTPQHHFSNLHNTMHEHEEH